MFNVKLLFGSKTYETPQLKYKITSRNIIKSRNLFLIKYVYIFWNHEMYYVNKRKYHTIKDERNQRNLMKERG